MRPYIRNTIIGSAILIIFSVFAIYRGLWLHPITWGVVIIGGLGMILVCIVGHIELKHAEQEADKSQTPKPKCK